MTIPDRFNLAVWWGEWRKLQRHDPEGCRLLARFALENIVIGMCGGLAIGILLAKLWG